VNQNVECIKLKVSIWAGMLQGVERHPTVRPIATTSPSISVSGWRFSQARAISGNRAVNPFPRRDLRSWPAKMEIQSYPNANAQRPHNFK
jgi:hypothetical protein